MLWPVPGSSSVISPIGDEIIGGAAQPGPLRRAGRSPLNFCIHKCGALPDERDPFHQGCANGTTWEGCNLGGSTETNSKNHCNDGLRDPEGTRESDPAGHWGGSLGSWSRILLIKNCRPRIQIRQPLSGLTDPLSAAPAAVVPSGPSSHPARFCSGCISLCRRFGQTTSEGRGKTGSGDSLVQVGSVGSANSSTLLASPPFGSLPIRPWLLVAGRRQAKLQRADMVASGARLEGLFPASLRRRLLPVTEPQGPRALGKRWPLSTFLKFHPSSPPEISFWKPSKVELPRSLRSCFSLRRRSKATKC